MRTIIIAVFALCFGGSLVLVSGLRSQDGLLAILGNIVGVIIAVAGAAMVEDYRRYSEAKDRKNSVTQAVNEGIRTVERLAEILKEKAEPDYDGDTIEARAKGFNELRDTLFNYNSIITLLNISNVTDHKIYLAHRNLERCWISNFSRLFPDGDTYDEFLMQPYYDWTDPAFKASATYTQDNLKLAREDVSYLLTCLQDLKKALK